MIKIPLSAYPYYIPLTCKRSNSSLGLKKGDVYNIVFITGYNREYYVTLHGRDREIHSKYFHIDRELLDYLTISVPIFRFLKEYNWSESSDYYSKFSPSINQRTSKSLAWASPSEKNTLIGYFFEVKGEIVEFVSIEGNHIKIKRGSGKTEVHIKTSTKSKFSKDTTFYEPSQIVKKGDKFVLKKDIEEDIFNHKILRDLKDIHFFVKNSCDLGIGILNTDEDPSEIYRKSGNYKKTKERISKIDWDKEIKK